MQTMRLFSILLFFWWGGGGIYWNNCKIEKKAFQVLGAFICQGMFIIIIIIIIIKIGCFKVPTTHFPFIIFRGAFIRKNAEFERACV